MTHINNNHNPSDKTILQKDDTKIKSHNTDKTKVKNLLEEEKSKVAKLENDIKEMRNLLKKSEARCEVLVSQVETLTIAKTKAVAETSRMTTLADSLQELLDSKKKEVSDKIEESIEPENNKTDSNSRRKSKCRHWNKGYCFKGQQCSWYHAEEDCPEYLQEGKCSDRNCSKRHRRVCRYWANKYKSCHRGTSCQYLHKSVQISQNNHSILDFETYQEANIENEYENNTHVEVSLEEEIRQTVIKILKEMSEESYGEDENLHSDNDEENED